MVTITLESTFSQTVNTGIDYHVFLTPNGDCKGLYVTRKTASSFEVLELEGGQSDVDFDYRVMARRKGYENIRLADKTKQLELPMITGRKPVGTQMAYATFGTAYGGTGGTADPSPLGEIFPT